VIGEEREILDIAFTIAVVRIEIGISCIVYLFNFVLLRIKYVCGRINFIYRFSVAGNHLG